MISIRQIKAARALLGWTQSDLANKVGLSLKALNAIEQMSAMPRASTLAAIETALRESGVAFLEKDGVQMAGEALAVTKLEGPEMMRLLTDDVLDVMAHDKRLKLTLTPDLRVFELGDGLQRGRYDAAQQAINFKEKILVPDTSIGLQDTAHISYRKLPPDVIGTLTFIIYGDRHAVVLPEQGECLITRSSTLCDAYRAQFEFLWSIAKPL